MYLEDSHGNRVGFICDRCGTVIDHSVSGNGARTDDFSVNYNFGYGTKLDLTTVSFQICDLCLYEIVEKEIPKAIIKQR